MTEPIIQINGHTLTLAEKRTLSFALCLLQRALRANPRHRRHRATFMAIYRTLLEPRRPRAKCPSDHGVILMPLTYLDVIGTTGGKATVETKKP